MDTKEMMERIASGRASARELADFARSIAQASAAQAEAERKEAEAMRDEAVYALTEALDRLDAGHEAHKDRAYRVTSVDGKWRVEVISTAPVAVTGKVRRAAASGGERAPAMEYPHLINNEVVGRISMSETAIAARKMWVDGFDLKTIAAETQPNSPTNTAQCAKNIGDAQIREALRAGILDPVTLKRL